MNCNCENKVCNCKNWWECICEKCTCENCNCKECDCGDWCDCE